SRGSAARIACSAFCRSLPRVRLLCGGRHPGIDAPAGRQWRADTPDAGTGLEGNRARADGKDAARIFPGTGSLRRVEGVLPRARCLARRAATGNAPPGNRYAGAPVAGTRPGGTDAAAVDGPLRRAGAGSRQGDHAGGGMAETHRPRDTQQEARRQGVRTTARTARLPDARRTGGGVSHPCAPRLRVASGNIVEGVARTGCDTQTGTPRCVSRRLRSRCTRPRRTRTGTLSAGALFSRRRTGSTVCGYRRIKRKWSRRRGAGPGHRASTHPCTQGVQAAMANDTPRVALITGATRRLGRASAEALHARGLNVIIHYRRSDEEATALVNALNTQRKNSAYALCADL